jgi:hypothetical protein
LAVQYGQDLDWFGLRRQSRGPHSITNAVLESIIGAARILTNCLCLTL